MVKVIGKTDEIFDRALGAESLTNMSDHYLKLIEAVGEDPGREGLLKTPDRAARALRFLTSGYKQDLDKVINGALFDEKNGGLVAVRNIEFYSLCEHHLLPFYGRVHIGYVPNGKVIGLSKAPRIVDVYARRLQIQERLTRQIAEAIEYAVHPKGVAVVVEATHMCVAMRGVQKQNASMSTRRLTGVFEEDANLRAELFDLIRNGS